MKKNKTDQKVKSNLYNLLPSTDSLKAVKILVMLIHCYRIIKNFMSSTSKLKKHLGETLTAIAKNTKSIQTINLDKLTGLFNQIDTDSMYTPERQSTLLTAIENGKAPGWKLNGISIVENTRNIDHKALTPHTHVQQLASNINSLLNGKSNRRTSVIYDVDSQTIDAFTCNLDSYLKDEISIEEMKKYISTEIV